VIAPGISRQFSRVNKREARDSFSDYSGKELLYHPPHHPTETEARQIEVWSCCINPVIMR